MSTPALGNTIGGSTANAGNLISGNIVGIMISGAQSSGNVVAGNLVGPGGSGGAGVGNTVGVYINGAPGNSIGVAAGNVISGNSSVGVYILGSTSTGNIDRGQRDRPGARTAYSICPTRTVSTSRTRLGTS